jgi:hypothetical protein
VSTARVFDPDGCPRPEGRRRGRNGRAREGCEPACVVRVRVRGGRRANAFSRQVHGSWSCAACTFLCEEAEATRSQRIRSHPIHTTAQCAGKRTHTRARTHVRAASRRTPALPVAHAHTAAQILAVWQRRVPLPRWTLPTHGDLRGRGLCSCPVCLTARTDALNALLDQKANVRGALLFRPSAGAAAACRERRSSCSRGTRRGTASCAAWMARASAHACMRRAGGRERRQAGTGQARPRTRDQRLHGPAVPVPAAHLRSDCVGEHAVGVHAPEARAPLSHICTGIGLTPAASKLNRLEEASSASPRR